MSKILTTRSRTGSRVEDDSNHLAICDLGLDMVGPFKRSKDKKSHLLVAVDKFTKWVEAEPVSKCDAATVVQFIKKVIFLVWFSTQHHNRQWCQSVKGCHEGVLST